MNRRAPDAGESLIELLMAIAIIGIAFSAILAGLGTAVTVSGINRHQAQDTSDVRAVAERIQAASWTPCADAAYYGAALAAVPPPTGSTRSLAIAYWNGASFGTTCNALTTALHRVTITTTPADDRAQAMQPLEVLKRKP